MIFCQNIIYVYFLIKKCECFVCYLIKHWKNKIKIKSIKQVIIFRNITKFYFFVKGKLFLK